MCGLFFVLQRREPIDRDRFRRALNTMQHRGPDHVGPRFYSRAFESEGGMCHVHARLGLQRLAILALDPRSDQPLAEVNKALVYNGEIYNYREVKQARVITEDTFKTTSDTELVLKLVAKGKLDRIGLLNGMWAFCYFD